MRNLFLLIARKEPVHNSQLRFKSSFEPVNFLFHSLSFCLPGAHTHSHTLTHTHTLLLALTHTHTLSHMLTLKHTHFLSLTWMNQSRTDFYLDFGAFYHHWTICLKPETRWNWTNFLNRMSKTSWTECESLLHLTGTSHRVTWSYRGKWL